MPTLSEYLSLTKLFKKDIKTVYANIEDEVNNDITLNDLDNISKTSKEGLMLYLPSYISWFLEEYVFKIFKKDVQDLIDSNTSQTERWWTTEMKKFQDGDTLLWNEETKKYYYEAIDTTKQIIKFCSATSTGGVCSVKIAKADRSPLTIDEINRAITYGDRVQPAGANITYVSIASDLLKCPMTLYYDPLKDVVDIKPLVESAINAYLEVLNEKGEYNVNSFEDAIQSVTDIKRIKRGTIEAKPDGGVYAEVTDIVYLTLSGFIKVDPAFPLATIITYLPA
jgi:hypothetical protein